MCIARTIVHDEGGCDIENHGRRVSDREHRIGSSASFNPHYLRRAFRRTLTAQDIDDLFAIGTLVLERDSQTYDYDAFLLSGIWRFPPTGQSTVETDRADFAKAFDRSGRGVSKVLETVERGFIKIFGVTD